MRDPNPILVFRCDGNVCGYMLYERKPRETIEITQFYTQRVPEVKVGSVLLQTLCVEEPDTKKVAVIPIADAKSGYLTLCFKEEKNSCFLSLQGTNLNSWRHCENGNYPRYKI